MDWRAPEKPASEIVLKYYWKNIEIQPSDLKTALSKLKTVKSVDLPAGTKTAVVAWTGKCNQLGSLETAALNAGVPALVLNHAHVVVGLRPLKGGDPKAAASEIGVIEGVQGVTSNAGGVELHADLEKLTVASLREAASKYKCEIIVNQTFEYVKYKVVEGESGAFLQAADALKGVMVVRDEDEGVVGMWINKAMVKTDQIEKLAGFKVERQP